MKSINLKVGNPYFGQHYFDRAIKAVVARDLVSTYPAPLGEPALIEAVEGFYSKLGVAGANVLVMSGALDGLRRYMSLLKRQSPQQVHRLVINDIDYHGFNVMARDEGYAVSRVDLWTITDLNPFRGAVLIATTLSNPTGRVLSRERIAELHAMCRAGGVTLLVDGAYSHLLENDFAVLDGVVELRTFSKMGDRKSVV